jgi:hypothetical protein
MKTPIGLVVLTALGLERSVFTNITPCSWLYIPQDTTPPSHFMVYDMSSVTQSSNWLQIEQPEFHAVRKGHTPSIVTPLPG